MWRFVAPAFEGQYRTIIFDFAGAIPVAQRHRSSWGDPETWGLLTPDWRGVANPGVLDLLRSMIPPRTGPGII